MIFQSRKSVSIAIAIAMVFAMVPYGDSFSFAAENYSAKKTSVNEAPAGEDDGNRQGDASGQKDDAKATEAPEEGSGTPSAGLPDPSGEVKEKVEPAEDPARKFGGTEKSMKSLNNAPAPKGNDTDEDRIYGDEYVPGNARVTMATIAPTNGEAVIQANSTVSLTATTQFSLNDDSPYTGFKKATVIHEFRFQGTLDSGGSVTLGGYTG